MAERQAEHSYAGRSLQVWLGDITAETTAAIVNAANEHLAHGGGVAGAISRRGGPAIQAESDRWIDEHGSVPTGSVAITSGGDLACRYVIHAVGPIWDGGQQGEPEQLRSAVLSSLQAASDRALTSIALPAISSGIFGFPKERCAAIMLRATCDFLDQHPETTLREIHFTNIDQPTTSYFVAELRRLQAADPPA